MVTVAAAAAGISEAQRQAGREESIGWVRWDSDRMTGRTDGWMDGWMDRRCKQRYMILRDIVMVGSEVCSNI